VLQIPGLAQVKFAYQISVGFCFLSIS
jgi:hypothetical protein